MLSTVLGSLNAVAAIVVVFGLCLLCHEAGHMAVAKASGMLVEEFAFGFGPPLLRFRRGETVYRLNLFFFIGGYVRIAGMEPGAEESERGFHSRPRWQGALVIIAGSVANLLLAFVIFTAVTYWKGLPNLRDTGIYIEKVAAQAPAARAGLQRDDQILSVDGENQSLEVVGVVRGLPAEAAGLRGSLEIDKIDRTEVYTPSELLAALRAAAGRTVTVETINYLAHDLSDQYKLFQLPVPPQMARATTERALEKLVGLRFGALYQGALVGYISARPDREVRLAVRRQGRVLDIPVRTMSDYDRYSGRNDKGVLYSSIRKVGRIGIVMEMRTRPVGFLEGLKAGAVRTYGAAASVPLSIKAMIRKQVETEFAGPVAIMAMSVQKARIGWDQVLTWGGIISSILAIMNLLPIPPFDGFRLALTGYEAIVRRRIDARKEMIIGVAGVIFVLLVFVILTYKDLANLFRYGTV